MVMQRHVQLQHAGTNQLIADIRTRYWIIGSRRLVRSVISNCVICMRYRSQPLQAPAAPLPNERMACNAPFQNTGVDLAGPLYLRNGEKCWIVLYTCAVYRAVHLELTRSLSTEAFMMTLRRFIARRGRVDMLVSDQGSNFIGTKNLLTNLDWEEIQRQSTIRRIAWKMNVPTAAWWGGYWERLIRIMKDLLKRVLGKASVSYDELQTLICDCEAIMNGRPLTYINNDNGEYLEPLTPALFIQPLPKTDVTDLDIVDNTSLNRRLKYLQNLREQFRQRFKSEYLTVLVQKGKEKKDILKIGDIVLVENEEKRIKWPLGIVEQLIQGKDGVERLARVRTSLGTKMRPVQRLYKLEVHKDNEFPDLNNTPNISTDLPPSGELSTSSDLSSKNKQLVTRSGRISKIPSKLKIYHV
ncbi:uncharacterized protein LOC128200650 [Galleria mellonella]|uniref:Uncharacterized protein LOC128200650 n=1 Tax=Galleria mellonella TaxID=7137 RepID=A0ABM3MH41_GALME|nr:uncharacterized protein LOC128200650 [Galleria mellonella]